MFLSVKLNSPITASTHLSLIYFILKVLLSVSFHQKWEKEQVKINSCVLAHIPESVISKWISHQDNQEYW